MTKLKYYGYKEKKVQLRKMSLAELKLYILKAYSEKGNREIQLIDILSGDTITFNSPEDVFCNEWCDSCKIELVNLPHAYGTADDKKTIIIFQCADDFDRVIS